MDGTCRQGFCSPTYTQANVLTVSRINLVDPLPTAVMLKGEAVEDAAGIKLIPAIPRRQSSRFRVYTNASTKNL